MEISDVSQGWICRIQAVQPARQLSLRPEDGMAVDCEQALGFWHRVMELPFGEQARCHLPHFAVALGRDDTIHWHAAICWQCNNISVCRDGEYSWRTFDSKSSEAQRLLADLRGCFDEGGPVDDESSGR